MMTYIVRAGGTEQYIPLQQQQQKEAFVRPSNMGRCTFLFRSSYFETNFESRENSFKPDF